MLGDDDHNDIDNEPINAADLFGDDLDAGENGGDNVENNDAAGEAKEGQPATDAPAPARKKYRQINRLANLNDLWLVDPKKENIGKVNSYFNKMKFRKGKGQERENLKLILQRYEYYGQQCYPKLCFKDFVEKVEFVSGKRSIKHALQKIRKGLDDEEEDEIQLDGDGENDFGIDLNINNDVGPDDPQPAQVPPPQPQQDSDENPPTPPPSSQKPVAMTDEMREMIRKKREEALAKRKKRLDESFVDTQTNSENQTEKDENSSIAENEEEQSQTMRTSQNKTSEDRPEPNHDEGSHKNIETPESNLSQDNVATGINNLEEEDDVIPPKLNKVDVDFHDEDKTEADDIDMTKISTESDSNKIKSLINEQSDTISTLAQASTDDTENQELTTTNPQDDNVDTGEVQDDKMEVDE